MKAKDLKVLRKKFLRVDRIGSPLEDLKVAGRLNDIISGPWKLKYFAGPSAPINSLLDLFERNMGDFYRKSSWGLDLVQKADDLAHRRARHLILYDDNEQMAAYCHYQYDYDDEENPERVVFYVYELQIEERYQRMGLGTKLMKCMEYLAQSADLDSVLLTVFFENTSAMVFYQNLGYEVDISSPSMFNQREDYEILFKKVDAL
jgi:ribosomal protein S18 acetylase RimI-like enzyme